MSCGRRHRRWSSLTRSSNSCVLARGDKLRPGHDLDFTTTYVFARNPEPLAAIELLAGVAGEVGDW
jgi:hypothetical protein